MGAVADAVERDLEELTADAIVALDRAAEDLVAWCDVVRDADMPWAFRWAADSTRGANVAASNYILQAAHWCGVLDRVLTPEQKRQGARWVRSMQDGDNTYADPALVDRKPPHWNDAEENWPPDGAHKEANNQYARGCLRFYEGERIDQLMGPTPPAWPQRGDRNVLDWIKRVEPNWSWIGRMFHRLLPWYHEGAIPRDVLWDCFAYAHSRQDPATGFWAGGIQPTFKLLIALHDPAELPVPRADRILDSVLRVMDEPTYDDDLFPCEEFDAFYDLAMAATSAPGYREDEVRKVAAHRVRYILDTRRQADRGLASYPDRCIGTWLKYDMAPPKPQGDAFGWGIYGYGINICVDLLGIADRCAWTGRWRQREEYDTRVFIEVGKQLTT